MTRAEAFRFFNQASFGARPGESVQLIDTGIEAWIDSQMAAPVSLQLPHLQSLPVPANPVDLQTDRIDIWYRNVLHGEDQLRQRVAFALSQILVVSQIGALFDAPYALADYYDLLARHAFGNYRDLLEAVTLHPAMGVYLSMLGNRKPDPNFNIRPDENYARELMQLFSIGLVMLNTDGSLQRQPNGQGVPTYNQAVIEGFAHVFTGWHWADAPVFWQAQRTLENQIKPMQLYPDFHDSGEKLLLNETVLPAGQAGEMDLAAALDNIFNHPNVGPFLAYRLIQRLVTSNPSPAYVQRVADVFNDNGSGERGDLAAVVRAILLDAEARAPAAADSAGKLKEPLLRLVHLWRAYDAQARDGTYTFPFAYFVFGQGPLQSPSVFNFFSPFYAPPGEIRNAGLVSPEMQLTTEFQSAFVTNYFATQIFEFHSENPNLGDEIITIDIAEELAVAADSQALIDMVADKLLTDTMSDALREEIERMLEVLGNAPETAIFRVAETLYLVVTSPEFATQH